MTDLTPLKDIGIFDVLESLAIYAPDNVKSRHRPQIVCPLPDHDERSPSFTIYPEDNTWWCFGCGQGNDAIDLVQKMTGLDFRGAVDHLAELAGVVLGEGDRRAPELQPEEVLRLVADQAHADVREWAWTLIHRDDPRIKGLETVKFLDEVFATYDEILRAERAREIDSQDAIKRLLAWRVDWKKRLI
jgi:hypothetical protein